MRKKLTELRQAWLNDASALFMHAEGEKAETQRAEAVALARCADDLGKAMESEGA